MDSMKSKVRAHRSPRQPSARVTPTPLTPRSRANPRTLAPTHPIHSAQIALALEADSVSVVDESGDGQHVSIAVVSSAFESKSSMERQRMVYKAIWEELQEAVHAVDAMSCKTPEEA